MCSLVCGRAYAHPNVSATLPSKGKRVRYLGLARARITRQACSYAFAHEMHAHSQPPVTPSRLAKKCCISTCAKADGEHVAGSMSALELYLSRHTPLAYTQRIYGKSMQVRVRVCPCVRCVLARVLRGDGWDLSRCSEMPIELFPSWPQYACLAHSFCVLAVADGLRVIDYYGRRGIATSEFACLEAGTTLYYTHMMRALSARTGSKRGRHLPAQNATSAFA